MALNKAMLTVLKAVSYADINVKKNYKLERQLVNLTHRRYMKQLAYQFWDHKVKVDDHEVPVRLYPAPQSVNDSLLIFYHGGGWVTGNIDSYDKVCANLAKATNSTVISVDYRLAPEYKFPCALEDCYAIARDVFLDDALFDIPKERIALIGDSAGGNLAAAVSLMARDRGEFLPQKQILLYPSTYNDHTEHSPYESIRTNGKDYFLTSKRIRDYMELYISKPEDFYNPYFAPLLSKDLSNQPNTLIITAEYDPLRDEGEDYGERLKEFGNRVKNIRMKDSLHGFITLPPVFQQVRTAYEQIADFLKK